MADDGGAGGTRAATDADLVIGAPSEPLSAPSRDDDYRDEQDADPEILESIQQSNLDIPQADILFLASQATLQTYNAGTFRVQSRPRSRSRRV